MLPIISHPYMCGCARLTCFPGWGKDPCAPVRTLAVLRLARSLPERCAWGTVNLIDVKGPIGLKIFVAMTHLGRALPPVHNSSVSILGCMRGRFAHSVASCFTLRNPPHTRMYILANDAAADCRHGPAAQRRV